MSSSTMDLSSTYNRVVDLHRFRRTRQCHHGCTHNTSTPIQQTHEPFYQRPEYSESRVVTTTQVDHHQRTDSGTTTGCECRSTPSTTEAKDRYSSSRLNIYDSSKVDEIQSEEEVQGPPLPPRPPLRPRHTFNYRSRQVPHSSGVRKYVIWCLICGGTSLLLGMMFLAVYFMLRTYTTTVAYFETIPTFVPATLLILTGICIMSLARRRNRYSYLIKLSGAFGIASALMCALVTITTTVIHMSRLQSLRECEYQMKTRTCTCYTHTQEDIDFNRSTEEPSIRFVFDSTTDCDVVHGALYSCLRTIFGISVAGVLISVFSCMLVYQLLSHERKKMYWEQLELRCRSLYSTQPPPPTATVSTVGPLIGTPRSNCRCCEQCHAHRQMSQTYPWDTEARFWIPGQAGNFYSPNPGEDLVNSTNRNRRGAGGWSWRLPWQRNDRFRTTPSSPDSQYGFSNNVPDQLQTVQSNYTLINAPYGVWGPPPPYSDPNSPARRGRTYQYVNPMQCQQIVMPEPIIQTAAILECHQEPQQPRPKRQKIKDEVTLSDSDGQIKVVNTLPVRKMKKRPEQGAKSIANVQQSPRVNVQEVFREEPSCSTTSQPPPKTRRIGEVKVGEGAESDVYFADVSSCCNISIQNDNHYYEDAASKKSPQENSSFSQEEVDDYLAQRFGKREASTRSRLPFPQIAEIFDHHPKQQHSSPNSLPKDNSRQSMCSVESGEKTDFTDLSPATPGTNYPFPIAHQFVAGSSPYNEQSQEALTKRLISSSSKNSTLQDVFLDVKNLNLDTTPLTAIYESSSGGHNHDNHYNLRASPAANNKRLASTQPMTSKTRDRTRDITSDHHDRRL